MIARLNLAAGRALWCKTAKPSRWYGCLTAWRLQSRRGSSHWNVRRKDVRSVLLRDSPFDQPRNVYVAIVAGLIFASGCNTSRVTIKPRINALRSLCTLVLVSAIFIRWKSWKKSISSAANVSVTGTETVSEVISKLTVAIGESQIKCSLSPHSVAVSDCKFVHDAQTTNRSSASCLNE